jgi:transcriptional regulator with XRE-family HTH domain
MRPADPDQLIENVGLRVAEVRISKGLTQEALAEALGVSLKHIQRLEAGRNLTLRTLVLLANGLDVRPAALLEPARLKRSGPGRPKGAARGATAAALTAPTRTRRRSSGRRK